MCLYHDQKENKSFVFSCDTVLSARSFCISESLWESNPLLWLILLAPLFQVCLSDSFVSLITIKKEFLSLSVQLYCPIGEINTLE